MIPFMPTEAEDLTKCMSTTLFDPYFLCHTNVLQIAILLWWENERGVTKLVIELLSCLVLVSIKW